MILELTAMVPLDLSFQWMAVAFVPRDKALGTGQRGFVGVDEDVTYAWDSMTGVGAVVVHVELELAAGAYATMPILAAEVGNASLETHLDSALIVRGLWWFES